MNNNEIWLPISLYEGIYEVSSDGRVKSLERNINIPNAIRKQPGIIRKLRTDSLGRYVLVDLKNNGVSKTQLVHRLVATAFIPNPYLLPDVNHINGIKTDNRVSNLEWCTQHQNEIHKYQVIKVPHPFIGRKGNLHVRSRPVLRISVSTSEILEEFESIRIAEQHGYISSCISLCCQNKQKTHKGFIWKYKTG